jgi:hydrogenase small subunit
MKVSRREFLKYCGVSAATLGLSATDLGRLKEVLANPAGPTVVWLQGSACTGCSISFLNMISPTAPTTAADVLVNSINLIYHPNLMALAGDSAVAEIEKVFYDGEYLLVIEGGVPTKFGGNTCLAWSYRGKDVTFQQAVRDLSSRAAGIICVGTCASFGGIPAAPPNPTGVKSVKAVTGKNTINIAGCPPHPSWVAGTLVNLLIGKTIMLDSYGRPKDIFTTYTVHDLCPRQGTEKAESFGVDSRCLRELGCRGPETIANCPMFFWNGGVNWCVDANAPCIGCTSSTFPGRSPFYRITETTDREDDSDREDD